MLVRYRQEAEGCLFFFFAEMSVISWDEGF